MYEEFTRNNLLIQDRIITFLVPDKITTDGFFHKNTDVFKWAKNSIEAKNDIIHDTTKHLHFENVKIYDSIPQNIRSQGKVTNPLMWYKLYPATDNDFTSQWPPLKVELDPYLYLKSTTLLIYEMGMVVVMRLVTKIVIMVTEKLMAMVTWLPATQFWTFLLKKRWRLR